MKRAIRARDHRGVPAAKSGTMTICMDPAYTNVPEIRAHRGEYPDSLSNSPAAMPTKRYENNTGATFFSANLYSFNAGLSLKQGGYKA